MPPLAEQYRMLGETFKARLSRGEVSREWGLAVGEIGLSGVEWFERGAEGAGGRPPLLTKRNSKCSCLGPPNVILEKSTRLRAL